MATLYDVLGVSARATPEEIRRTYLQLAQILHPDRNRAVPKVESDRTSRRMQEVNEAWRVLRDPVSRDVYDRSLQRVAERAAVPPWQPTTRPAAEATFDDDLDRPYPSPLAEPGDIGVSVVRALPWLAVAVVLMAIFVFTAFAGGNGDDADSPRELVGKCVASGNGSDVASVPCEGPNDGQVVLVVERPSLCPGGSTTRAVSGGLWICLAPAGQS